MEIKWKFWGKEREKSLRKIIEDRLFLNNNSQLEATDQKVDNATLFSAKTVELLYKKGILSKDDIKEIIDDFDYFDEDCNMEIID